MRKAGLLMPVSALPSDYGVGDLGKGCMDFIDYMQACGFSIWQILPLNPLGYGNSPYQPYSSFAGDEIYLDLNTLADEGLLQEIPQKYHEQDSLVNYEKVRTFKRQWLKKAYKNHQPSEHYQSFIKEKWVYPYAVFMTLKRKNHMKCWNEWTPLEKNWIQNPEALDISGLQQEIGYEMFVQFLFHCQWNQVKAYANERGIAIMGDIPFYVGIDSLDVWMNQNEFLLDANGKPTFIAGVPPDYFSATGQRWGNPIYDWMHMEKNGFSFWKERFLYNTALFDIIRIDHFRAFDTYWKIPASCETAMEGAWVLAPGYAFFDILLKEFDKERIVAEDLGDMRPQVYELRDAYGFPGMKIIQFTFDPKEHNNDFEDRKNMVVYTGTHDNETILGWWLHQSRKVQELVRRELAAKGYEKENMNENILRYTLDNLADTAILPVWDILEMDNTGRMNTPGTLGSPNWEWRLTDMEGLVGRLSFVQELLKGSGRDINNGIYLRKTRF